MVHLELDDLCAIRVRRSVFSLALSYSSWGGTGVGVDAFSEWLESKCVLRDSLSKFGFVRIVP